MAIQNKDNTDPKNSAGKHEHPLPQEISPTEQKITKAAHDQAEHDMEEDPDFSLHSPNDDLDEGETARLGGDGNPII